MKKTFVIFILAVFVLSAAASSVTQETARAEKMRPALLVIDIQNEFLPNMSESDRKTALEYINGTIRRFHDKRFPVIRIYQSHPAAGPKPGSQAFEFPQTVLIKPDDPMIIKTYSNAFNKTGLEKLLKEKGCNVLFLCGLSADACVLATYHGAQDLDYDAFLIREALLSPDSATTRFVAGLCETVSYGALKAMIKYAPSGEPK
ncbi:MAG: isochorismatase hydrolase [Candidatus Aminicenantes bacterium]|jgi:nicotinamidase-related amidase|nr:isochorismatase hydrolase [Candidatus Aminicenantes bacterium]